jgi:hypothetical protein
MRKFLCVLAIAGALPLVGGCTKSVERAQQDVRQAQERAAETVRREQADLEDTQREAAERIARQERRVEDAARGANKEVIEEKRELEEAKRAEERREPGDVPPADQPAARVDVNINRGPGARGVDVDVKRNP